MVQMIQLYQYRNCYPFGLQKQSQCTYVEYIKQITNENQFASYEKNLTLFKSIVNELVIPLDSYIREEDRLQLYYYYEPVSLKTYIENKIIASSVNNRQQKFLLKIIEAINASIDQLISLLMLKHILAILSIENIAVSNVQKIRFFIEPDFDYIENPSKNQLIEYYQAEKKKLKIQLQQVLEHIIQFIQFKPKNHSKANFVIQGTRLVFVNEGEASPNSKAKVILLKQLSSPSKNSQQTQINARKDIKYQFDIKNILDQKKLRKNQSQFNTTLASSSPVKNEFNKLQRQQRQNQKDQKDREEFRKEKQIKNYFENNDNFNRDTSFYPEEFVKDQSIAEFQGYQDELEKELENLKKLNYHTNSTEKSPTKKQNTESNTQHSNLKIAKLQECTSLSKKTFQTQLICEQSKNFSSFSSSQNEQSFQIKESMLSKIPRASKTEGSNHNQESYLKFFSKQIIQGVNRQKRDSKLESCNNLIIARQNDQVLFTQKEACKQNFNKQKVLSQRLPIQFKELNQRLSNNIKQSSDYEDRRASNLDYWQFFTQKQKKFNTANINNYLNSAAERRVSKHLNTEIKKQNVSEKELAAELKFSPEPANAKRASDNLHIKKIIEKIKNIKERKIQ